MAPIPEAHPLETTTPSAVPDILAPGLAVVLRSIHMLPTTRSTEPAHKERGKAKLPTVRRAAVLRLQRELVVPLSISRYKV